MTRASTREGRNFADIDEVELAYNLDQVEVHSEIQVVVKTWYDENNDVLPSRKNACSNHRWAGDLQPYPAARDPVHQPEAG